MMLQLPMKILKHSSRIQIQFFKKQTHAGQVDQSDRSITYISLLAFPFPFAVRVPLVAPAFFTTVGAFACLFDAVRAGFATGGESSISISSSSTSGVGLLGFDFEGSVPLLGRGESIATLLAEAFVLVLLEDTDC